MTQPNQVLIKATLVYDDGQTRDLFPTAAPPPPPPPPPDPDDAPPDPVTPPDPGQTPGTWFQVFQTWSGNTLPAGDPEETLWSSVYSRIPLGDPPIPPANIPYGHIPGRSRWNDVKDNPAGAHGADRIAYNTLYFFLQHTDRLVDSDTAHHDFLDIIRFHFQAYGVANQVNDKGMRENPFGAPAGETQGEPQYPYEPGVRPVAVARRYPGAVVRVFHFRKVAGLAPRLQLLRSITIPATDPHNSHTKWWYQLGGLVVATNDRFVAEANPDGVIAKLIISALHPAYTFKIQGV